MHQIMDGKAWFESVVLVGLKPDEEELRSHLRAIVIAVKALQDAPEGRYTEKQKAMMTTCTADVIRAAKTIKDDYFAPPIESISQTLSILADVAIDYNA